MEFNFTQEDCEQQCSAIEMAEEWEQACLDRGEIEDDVAEGGRGGDANVAVGVIKAPEEGRRHVVVHHAAPQRLGAARQAAHAHACSQPHLRAHAFTLSDIPLGDH